MKWNNFIFATTLLAASCGKQESESMPNLANLDFTDGTSYFVGKNFLNDYHIYKCKPNQPRSKEECDRSRFGYEEDKVQKQLTEYFQNSFEFAAKKLLAHQQKVEKDDPVLTQMKKSINHLDEKIKSNQVNISELEVKKSEMVRNIANAEKFENIYNNQIAEIDKKLLETPDDLNLISTKNLIIKQKELASKNTEFQRKELPIVQGLLNQVLSESALLISNLQNENLLYDQQKNYVFSINENIKKLTLYEKTMKNRLTGIPKVLEKINNSNIPYDINTMSVDEVVVVFKLAQMIDKHLEREELKITYSAKAMIEEYFKQNEKKLKFEESQFRQIYGHLEAYNQADKWVPIYVHDFNFEYICPIIGKTYLSHIELGIQGAYDIDWKENDGVFDFKFERRDFEHNYTKYYCL